MWSALAWFLIVGGIVFAFVNYLRFSGASGFDANADIAMFVTLGIIAAVLGALLHLVIFIASFF
jgi:hypothetical protein